MTVFCAFETERPEVPNFSRESKKFDSIFMAGRQRGGCSNSSSFFTSASFAKRFPKRMIQSGYTRPAWGQGIHRKSTLRLTGDQRVMG